MLQWSLKSERVLQSYLAKSAPRLLYYTEADRPLMETAWEMTDAHREDLVSRRSGVPALPAPPRVPRVLAMLQAEARPH